jgi:hypothetical protein
MKKGQTVKGSKLRNVLTGAFLEDLLADYKANGMGAIKIMRMEQPTKYCIMIANLLPKDISVDITENKLNELPTEQVDAVIEELAESLRKRTEGPAIPFEVRKGTSH